MTFDSVKNGIVDILKAQGYQESEAADFVNAPAVEYGSTFIVRAISGDMDNQGSETLSDRFYDFQTWQIQIAFEKSEQSDIINRDDVHRKKDTLIKELDDPANWRTYVRMQKYKSWRVEELKSYYLLTIEVKILDQYTY